MADAKLSALSAVSVPALDDLAYLVDISDTTDDAAGSSRQVALYRLLGLLNHVCQGRLTLESGVPVSTTDQTGKTSVYFTPYNGNLVSVYDSTRWKLYSFSELTFALGTLSNNTNYDLFLYDNSGTLTLEAASWTNDTTRATALTLQDGVYVKSGATTRRYLGTFRTTSTTTTEDSGGGTTTQVGGKRFLWNAYNRVMRPLAVKDTTDSWTYATNTVRQANAASGNKVEYVCGVASDGVVARVLTRLGVSSTNAGSVGVGVDVTNAFSGFVIDVSISTGSNSLVCTGFYAGNPGIGYHYLAWCEVARTATMTYYGDAGIPNNSQSGLSAEVWA